MGQITEDFIQRAMRCCQLGQHPPMTVWEARQLLTVWVEWQGGRDELAALRARVAELESFNEQLRLERDILVSRLGHLDDERTAGNKPAQQVEPCVQCSGAGKVYGSRGYEYRCEVCDGTGRRHMGLPDSADAPQKGEG